MKLAQDNKIYVALFSAIMLIAACANQMEPAKNELDNIGATLAATAGDAQTYVPDQLSSVQAEVTALNASFDKKDYAAVVTRAPAVLAEVKGLASAAAAKKDETLKGLGTEWRSLSVSIPQAVTAVQTRVDALSKSKRVPKDIDLAAAKSELTDASSGWDKAQSDFKSGDATTAVPLAKDAKSKLDAAAAALKLDLAPATT